jgi:hypothetical protein
MRIRVQDGDPASAPGPPRVANGDYRIVETAVSPEEIPTGMMPAGPDETEGIGQLAGRNPSHPLHHASHGDARGGSERIGLHL